MKFFSRRLTAGFTAVEIVVGVSLLSLIVVMSLLSVGQFLKTGRLLTEKTAAIFLAEEGLELVRFVRDNNWTNLSARTLNTPHYLSIGSPTIVYTNTPEIIGGFTRSFMVQNVFREPITGDIVASTTPGAVADSDSKYVTVQVMWGNPTTTVSLTSILANLNP